MKTLKMLIALMMAACGSMCGMQKVASKEEIQVLQCAGCQKPFTQNDKVYFAPDEPFHAQCVEIAEKQAVEVKENKPATSYFTSLEYEGLASMVVFGLVCVAAIYAGK